ncbi:MAG TPA: hypothetical protein VF181_12125 [Balneolaceae bacterium]
MRKIDTINERSTKEISPVVILAAIYAGLVALLSFAAFAGNILNIPLQQFTADPAVTFSAHPFVGMISYTGVLLWCSSAVVCLFSAAFLNAGRSEQNISFLLCSGLISLFLLSDDLFMLHEAIFPWYLDIPQKLVYVIYLVLMSSYFLYFRKRIWNSEYKILGIAIAFLALSVLGDFMLPQEGMAYVVEDGLKVFGIATWFIYFTRVSFKEVTDKLKYNI